MTPRPRWRAGRPVGAEEGEGTAGGVAVAVPGAASRVASRMRGVPRYLPAGLAQGVHGLGEMCQRGPLGGLRVAGLDGVDDGGVRIELMAYRVGRRSADHRL